MEQVSYQKIGTNRDTPRLWIEGAKLDTAGFVAGARYDIEVTGDTMRGGRRNSDQLLSSGD